MLQGDQEGNGSCAKTLTLSYKRLAFEEPGCSQHFRVDQAVISEDLILFSVTGIQEYGQNLVLALR